jgi:transcription-repair coupling factor (superfamily II helicase)
MISLLINHLQQRLRQYEPFQEIGRRLEAGSFPVEAEGAQGGFLSFLVGELHRGNSGSSLLVLPTEQEAAEVFADLSLVLPEGEASLFPWWSTLPYGRGRPLPATYGQRAEVLGRLLAGERLLLVASLRALLHPLPDPAYLAERLLRLVAGQAVEPVGLARRLQELGYLRVPRVSLRGEFALRGEVVDIYPFGGGQALRLVLEYDRLAEIRSFEPVTQASTGRREAATVPPTREVLMDGPALAILRQRLSASCDREAAAGLADSLSLNPDEPGSEYLFPLCFHGSFSLLDYLDRAPPADLRRGPLLFLADLEGLEAGSAALRKEYLQLYRKAYTGEGCPPPPRQILHDFTSLTGSFGRRIQLHALKGGAGRDGRVRLGCDPPRSFFGNVPFFREEVQGLLESGYRVFVFAEYGQQAERLQHLLKDLEVTVLPQGISSGFSLPSLKVIVIQENEIFGRKRRIPRSVAAAPSRPIESFVDLEPGDYVVHVQHGIGLFQGIERIRAAGLERDYIAIEYADGEKVFLPIEQVNLIQRYVGQEGKHPRLDKLGGRGWQSKKERVRRSVQEMARRLVALYSARNTVKGYAFPPDTDWQSEFEARFPYQETEDQLKAIEEVKMDMESPRPMDRLVCGDVGYGKTEVALRAAFKAVMGGRQVALLAPTTILAEQHFETFRGRFQGFPVEIAMLSRFLGRGEQKQVTQALAAGSADVVVGTHRVLQRDVAFKNLGLMIVDEEQRFGVRDKERLKELKTSVDCLTLTATPIPRTLHMALMKIRDMSVIDTPPRNRYPIETFIEEFDEEVIARAVRHEIERGGQVYYLHNRVQTIERIQAFLNRLLPQVRVAVAHGQMPEEELEEVMHGFIHEHYQLLLSTTIIENGLDIPNVNTIIIDRADMFGIAQLYQLRGRVGRSDTPAYAYLFYPKGRTISELAMKRLRIISDFTDLGSGFKIALKDLEIRGAGNLLGREQHGDILAVGLDMYLRLLDEAIEALQLPEGARKEEPPEVFLELEYSGYIPDGYMAEPMEKMGIYKKIASVTDTEELAAAERELSDRFGPMPDEVLSLFAIAEIRILCRRLFISSLRERDGEVTVEFSRLAQVSVDRVLTLIRDSGGSVALDPRHPNCLIIRVGSIGLKEKSEFISDRLSRLL